MANKSLISMEKRLGIREAYKTFEKEVEAGTISPYGLGIDWFKAFSPIEDNFWGSIRYFALPIYPQFPIGPYFVDFADVKRKIAFELDGAAYHKDHAKDMKRQREIEAMGWLVVRIPGWKTMKIRDDFMDENDRNLDREAYFNESAEGLLEKIYHDNGYFARRYEE